MKKPAVRIDGGRRINLAARRERRGLEIGPRDYPAPDPHDRDRSRRRLNQLLRADGGKEGAVTSVVKIRDLEGKKARTLTQTVRCLPGTFEWRYGRDNQSALYHAGSHFARLWERAGIAIASSADFLRGTASGYPSGISDARAAAAQKVIEVVREIGRFSAERLVAYCVLGETSTSIARRYGQSPRDMAAVLHQDLRAVAMHFRFL